MADKKTGHRELRASADEHDGGDGGPGRGEREEL